MIDKKYRFILPFITILLFCIMMFSILADHDKIRAPKAYFFIINEESASNIKISINTASCDEFLSLPGIGNVIAKRIVEYREKNGMFQSIEEIKNVKGIGESIFNDIKYYISI